MGTLFDYLKEYKNVSFVEEPFTEIDRLIMAELAYLNYEKLNIHSFEYLSELANDIEELTIDNFDRKRNKALFEEIIKSPRFTMLEVGYVNAINSGNMQFCAVTFRVLSNYFIVFRGTDLSISGWREDLELGVYQKLPSYDHAVSYADTILNLHTGRFEIIGHSKGGNIAFFVGSELIEKYQNKIVTIYNFDGPGFNYDILAKVKNTPQFAKFLKFIPKDDVVGLLLDNYDNYHIINSKHFGVFQHDLFFWQVEGTDLKRDDNITFLSKIFSKTVIDWVASLEFEEKVKILKLFDEFFINSDVQNLSQLKKINLNQLKKFISSYIGFSKDEKKMLTKLSFRMMKYYIDNSFDEIKDKINKENNKNQTKLLKNNKSE